MVMVISSNGNIRTELSSGYQSNSPYSNFYRIARAHVIRDITVTILGRYVHGPLDGVLTKMDGLFSR